MDIFHHFSPHAYWSWFVWTDRRNLSDIVDMMNELGDRMTADLLLFVN